MPKRALAALLLAAAMLMGGASLAAQGSLVYPVIPGFGAIVVVPGAAERPDPKLCYRVLFNVTKAASSPDQVNPSLEKVARFVNLLGADKSTRLLVTSPSSFMAPRPRSSCRTRHMRRV